jgi:hypothetical protein
LAYLTTATPYDRDTAQKLRRVGAAWGGQQPGQLRRRRPCRGLATAATRPSKVTLRRPAGASAHCCRVLDLDGTRGGQWNYGKVRCAGVRLVREC